MQPSAQASPWALPPAQPTPTAADWRALRSPPIETPFGFFCAGVDFQPAAAVQVQSVPVLNLMLFSLSILYLMMLGVCAMVGCVVEDVPLKCAGCIWCRAVYKNALAPCDQQPASWQRLSTVLFNGLCQIDIKTGLVRGDVSMEHQPYAAEGMCNGSNQFKLCNVLLRSPCKVSAGMRFLQ